MDKETLHRILVNPTRTGLDKVEKEVARLHGVNDVLRQELTTWKNAVATRNVTVEDLNGDLDGRKAELVRLYRELQEAANIVSEEKKQDALQIERLRISVQAAHSCVSDLASRFHDLNNSLDVLEYKTGEVRDHIAGDAEIDWVKELGRGSDDTDGK